MQLQIDKFAYPVKKAWDFPNFSVHITDKNLNKIKLMRENIIKCIELISMDYNNLDMSRNHTEVAENVKLNNFSK